MYDIQLQFTTQIFANMFNTFTQHLAAVATSISPTVRAQSQSTLQHTMRVLSIILGLAQPF